MNIELKDFFAAHAMQALIADNKNIDIDKIVITAYHISEKMIQRKNELNDVKNITTPKQLINELSTI